MNRKQAFTLVELLIAIVIVAILLILIAPVSALLRGQAHESRCLSNLRQAGAAALHYFNDRNGNLFPTKYWSNYPSWAPEAKNGMRDYLGVVSSLQNIASDPAFQYDSVVTCPEMRRQHPSIVGALNRTFSYNYYLNLKDPHSKYNSGPSADRPFLPKGPRKLANITSPSRTWIFMEGNVPSGATYYATSVSESSVPDLPHPHRGRQNIVYLDGHVESLTKEELVRSSEERLFWGKME